MRDGYYVMRLFVKKGRRMAWFDQAFRVKPGLPPPNLIISYVQGVQNFSMNVEQLYLIK